MASLGQDEASAFTGKKGFAQPFLQLAYLCRQGRLRCVQLSSRLGQVPRARDPPEVEQVVKVELLDIHCSVLCIDLF
jgi:hypothetical protein